MTTAEQIFQAIRSLPIRERLHLVERVVHDLADAAPSGEPPQSTDTSTDDDALEQWLAFLREGLALGGPPYPKRDELYDRGN